MPGTYTRIQELKQGQSHLSIPEERIPAGRPPVDLLTEDGTCLRVIKDANCYKQVGMEPLLRDKLTKPLLQTILYGNGAGPGRLERAGKAHPGIHE